MTDQGPEERMHEFLERTGCADLPLEELQTALTHRSFSYEAGLDYDNERHEFLGDALISAITSEALFTADPSADEGALSKRRSRLISRAVLGRCAIELGVGEIILLGRGERETGGARRRSILGSALEAIVAAIYLRLGYRRAQRFVLDHIYSRLIHERGKEILIEDYKSTLQEWSQLHLRDVPQYRLLEEKGPDHDKHFTVQVELAGRILAKGGGRRIKAAENEAAHRALKRIEQEKDTLFSD